METMVMQFVSGGGGGVGGGGGGGGGRGFGADNKGALWSM